MTKGILLSSMTPKKNGAYADPTGTPFENTPRAMVATTKNPI
jgi:hypothetical protein